MGNCWKQLAKDYLWSIIGEPCGGKGDYSDIVQEMDDIRYYNYPKNGEADSCAILCDNSLLHACTDPSYSDDPECAKWTALQAMYEPQNGSNAGAGCVQKIGYFKQAGEWYTDPSDFCSLDEIFFAKPEYISDSNPYGVYHTGMIVDWGYIEELGTDGFTVIEGNTNGGYVAYKYYAYNDPRILGAGRPNWDGWGPDDFDDSEKQEEKPKEDTQPVPDPADEAVVNVELPILRRGSLYTGEVYTIQALLKGFGFTDEDDNELVIDGIFGAHTESAVRKYQEARGLQVTGIVNAETWNRILK